MTIHDIPYVTQIDNQKTYLCITKETNQHVTDNGFRSYLIEPETVRRQMRYELFSVHRFATAFALTEAAAEGFIDIFIKENVIELKSDNRYQIIGDIVTGAQYVRDGDRDAYLCTDHSTFTRVASNGFDTYLIEEGDVRKKMTDFEFTMYQFATRFKMSHAVAQGFIDLYVDKGVIEKCEEATYRVVTEAFSGSSIKDRINAAGLNNASHVIVDDQVMFLTPFKDEQKKCHDHEFECTYFPIGWLTKDCLHGSHVEGRGTVISINHVVEKAIVTRELAEAYLDRMARKYTEIHADADAYRYDRRRGRGDGLPEEPVIPEDKEEPVIPEDEFNIPVVHVFDSADGLPEDKEEPVIPEDKEEPVIPEDEFNIPVVHVFDSADTATLYVHKWENDTVPDILRDTVHIRNDHHSLIINGPEQCDALIRTLQAVRKKVWGA